MSEGRSWGSTVAGWFIVRDDGTAASPAVDLSAATDAAPPPVPTTEPAAPAVFKMEPPSAPGGQVDFDGVFTAAGIEVEERDRVTKASTLLASLPAETPVSVKKQIVEASLKAFGVPVEQDHRNRREEIQALEVYIQAGHATPRRCSPSRKARIAELEAEITNVRTVMDERVHEQYALTTACNAKKLEVQEVLEFFGQEAVARVVHESPKLHEPSAPGARPTSNSHPHERGHADMAGFFGRLANLWHGFLSIWISDIEKEHPEIAYENAINSMIEKYSQLKKATAAIIRRREDISERLKKTHSELAQTEADLTVAVETNQDDLAVVLIQKKNQLANEVTDLKAELDTAQKDADSAKSSLMSVQTEIKKLKAEKDNMLAKMESAQARIRIQEQLDGLSVDAEVKALDNVREHIKNTIAEANLGAELGDRPRLASRRAAQSGRRRHGHAAARRDEGQESGAEGLPETM